MKNTYRATVRFNGVQPGATVNVLDLSPAQLRHAANVKERIGKLQRQFNRVLNEHPGRPASVQPVQRQKKFTMPLSARQAISRAQKRIWRKRRAEMAI